MSKIASAFEKGKAFIAFITCGDPDLETTAAVVRAAVENGADLIELGIRKNFGVTVVAVTLPDPSDGDNPQVDVSPAPGRKFSFVLHSKNAGEHGIMKSDGFERTNATPTDATNADEPPKETREEPAS